VPRKIDRSARRSEIAAAASRAFAQRGVAKTSVSDIVKAAGVAQGTFYLYFDNKDDVVLAVVNDMAERMIAGIAVAVDAAGPTAVDKFLALRDVLTAIDVDTTSVELARFLHLPENRPLHDRMAEHFVPALIPLMESIVAQGVEEGIFHARDMHAAAWFVLGGLQSAESSGTPVEQMPTAIAAATGYALRALGYPEVEP
jgi:TetR/AcrR family transcriptional regulator, fatty acid metabolism regulator protein